MRTRQGSTAADGTGMAQSPTRLAAATAAVGAAQALLDAACGLRSALEDDEAGRIAAALAIRERAAERLMALADVVANEPAAVALVRQVAAIDSETMGRASWLRREVEGALTELATARGVLARLLGDSAPRLVERTA